MNAILANPLAALDGKVGAASLLTDEASRELYRHDVYAAGPAPLAVFRPAESRFSHGFGRSLLETDVQVRSLLAWGTRRGG